MEHRTKRTKFSDNEESKVKEEMMIDKISHLPEPIIHHVLSLLPTRYAVRTSVLSHKWNSLWSTFPVINLTDLDFLDPGDERENPPEYSGYSDRFIDYLLLTLSHHNMKNLDLFRIYTLIRGHIHHYEVVELLLDEAMRGKLKNLDLKFAHRTHELINGENGEQECEECYKLPPTLFLFGLSLLSLKLEVMGLVELLQSMLMISVRHKTMCLDLENSCTVEMEFREHTRGEEMLDEHDHLRANYFVQDHLLEVRIKNFAGLLDDIRLVRFLICNASSLRNFSISIRDSSALPSETRYCSEVISRIHNLPKASPDAEILVSYS